MGVDRVEVDVQRCFGSGDCELALPEAFRVGDDGISEVLPGASEVPVQRLEQVALACPTGAIEIHP